jgi:hypothetical protein
MPNPQSLKVGDLIRFISIPEEWSRPGYWVPASSRAFMKAMIKRGRPARVYKIDESGQPWIRARLRQRGMVGYHSWSVFESTGWRLINRRSRGARTVRLQAGDKSGSQLKAPC